METVAGQADFGASGQDLMPRDASRLGGYAMLCYFSLSRLGAWRDGMLRDELSRQVHAVGISALPVVLTLAAITGATAVTQAGALAGQDSDLTQRLLVFGLFFELAPLLTALVIVARSSATIASELAVMGVHDEFRALRRMGVPVAEYLMLPRIAAMAVALPVATALFQAVAVISGWIASALLLNAPLFDIAARFFDFASPVVGIVSLAKAACMGWLAGVVATHHGSSSGRSTQGVSSAAMQAVGGGLVAVFLVDIAFALLAYFLR